MAWNTVFSEVRAIKQQFDVVFPISVNQEIIWFQIGTPKSSWSLEPASRPHFLVNVNSPKTRKTFVAPAGPR